MTGQGVLLRGVGVECDPTPAVNIASNKGYVCVCVCECECVSIKLAHVFQSLKTERAAVSMSGIPPEMKVQSSLVSLSHTLNCITWNICTGHTHNTFLQFSSAFCQVREKLLNITILW